MTASAFFYPIHRIDGFSVMADFKMQARALHRSGISQRGDHLSHLDRIALCLEPFFQMGVNRVVMIPMINDDHISEAFEPG